MEELLQRLEWQIKKLIDQQHQLTQSNQQLLAKQQKAIMQIEALVSKLKSIENVS